jgi:hypothetical protein
MMSFACYYQNNYLREVDFNLEIGHRYIYVAIYNYVYISCEESI